MAESEGENKSAEEPKPPQNRVLMDSKRDNYYLERHIDHNPFNPHYYSKGESLEAIYLNDIYESIIVIFQSFENTITDIISKNAVVLIISVIFSKYNRNDAYNMENIKTLYNEVKALISFLDILIKESSFEKYDLNNTLSSIQSVKDKLAVYDRWHPNVNIDISKMWKF